MDTATANRMWRDILPGYVCVSAGPLRERVAPLTARELQSAGAVDEMRMQELANGRAYAKCALAELGLRGVELPIAADRAPRWPEGIAGSLAHTTGAASTHIAAVVARTRDVLAIGIDVEYENDLPPRTWGHVLTASELDCVRRLPPKVRALHVQLSWCAKEAAAKAAGRRFDPTSLEIERDPEGNGFTASWRDGYGGREYAGRIWRGRTTRAEGFILAAVVLPCRPLCSSRRHFR